MKNNQAKFLFLITISGLLIISAQASAQVPASPSPASSDQISFFNTSFWQNVAVAVLSAVLAFFSGYALAGVGKKQGSGKKLAYSLTVENGLVTIEENIRRKVKVLYAGQEIENLYHVKFDLENTGSTVVKSEEIRFEFSEGTRILDVSFDPKLEPELKFEEIDKSRIGLKEWEWKCKIGQIEKGQNLGIRFTATNKTTATSKAELAVKIHPSNGDGDVEFVSRAITKALSEKEQIARFLSLFLMYFLIPPVFSLFPDSNISGVMAGIVRVIILLSIFRLIIPFSEAVSDMICKFRFTFSKNEGTLMNFYGSVTGVAGNVEGSFSSTVTSNDPNSEQKSN